MKIVIDLQACQTPGSRLRGIGRYSLELATAIVRNRRSHSIHFLLNLAFDDRIAALRNEFRADAGVTFESYRLIPFGALVGEGRRKLRRANDEILNWRYSLTGADVMHVSSVFEGFFAGDAHVSHRISEIPGCIRSATLYDLIPLLFEDIYLPSSARQEYLTRLSVFHQLDLVLAISESARNDAIRRLNIVPERIVNIGAAVSRAFRRLADLDGDTVSAVLSRHGVGCRFILYTGGIDHRKNIDFLLRAYAGLPASTRCDVQLVIVCEVSEDERRALERRTTMLGIADQALFTGFVPDEELNLLYNLCELFVFPSLYEGFGLPLLEAMTCGACVLSSNTSSMPEILGRSDVLFDPADSMSLSGMMNALLAAPARRRELAALNLHRSRSYSWDNVAQKTIASMEDAYARRRGACAISASRRRPLVALVTPLPPQRTGIADYCASMLPYWSRHFDLELIVENVSELDNVIGSYPVIRAETFHWHAHRFDSILYHFGNSPFHAWMYKLLQRFPGVVVLHDFFLSGLVHWMDKVGGEGGLFDRELATGHGMQAVLDADAVARGELQVDDLIIRYPVARRAITNARGLIFHSRFAQRLLAETYPDLDDVPSCVVPHASFTHVDERIRAESRAKLGIGPEEVLICAFGFLVHTKDNDLLLDALSRRFLAHDPRIRVVFVGELEAGPLQARLAALIAGHPLRDRISITGYVDERGYTQYLAACDIGVSLRSKSRGETSGAMQKQLAAGCATIVSDYASMRELPDDIVLKVPPSDADALARALKRLLDDGQLRARLGEASRRWIEAACHPVRVAEKYAAAISELTELDRARSAENLVRRIARVADIEAFDDQATSAAAEAIAAGIASHPASARWLPRYA